MIGASIRQEINDREYRYLMQRYKDLDELWVKVGFPENGENKGPLGAGRDGKEDIVEYSEILQIAAVHEFGAPAKSIPERSFMRSTFDRKHDDLDAFKTKWYDKVVSGKTSAGKALASIGEKLIAFTKTTIKNRIAPPLENPSRRRIGTKSRLTTGEGWASAGVGEPIPLIDTGQMINSLQFKVGRGGDNEGEGQGLSVITGEMQ